MLSKTSDPRVHSGLFLRFGVVLISLLVAGVVAKRADGQDTDVSLSQHGAAPVRQRHPVATDWTDFAPLILQRV